MNEYISHKETVYAIFVMTIIGFIQICELKRVVQLYTVIKRTV